MIPLQTELILNFNYCKQTTEGGCINPMRNIYVIIHHYFDEDNQKAVAVSYSEWDFYYEALNQVEVVRKLSKHLF